MKKLVILFIATIVSGGLYAAAIDAPTSPSNVLMERDANGIGVLRIKPVNASGLTETAATEATSASILAATTANRLNYSTFTVTDSAVRLSANATTYVAGESYDVWISCAGDCYWDFVGPSASTFTANTDLTGVTFSATSGMAGPVKIPVEFGIMSNGDALTVRVLDGGGL